MNISAIYHVSTDNYCYPKDENTLVIKIQTGRDVTGVMLVWGDPFIWGLFGSDDKWNGNNVQMQKMFDLQNNIIWQAEITPEYKRCRYYFVISSGDDVCYYVEDGTYTKNQFKNYKGRRQDFFFPWMNSADIIKPADWVNETIWYQIFPERFCSSGKNFGGKFKKWKDVNESVNSLDFYGGDLIGVTSKLDYLKNLGITGIYFTPVNLSNSNHKYSTTDYRMIDPDFGTEEDMRNLVLQAHERNIRVMMDGVFNHCGGNFEPWQDVCEKGKDSRYFDWFMINKYPFENSPGRAKRGEYFAFAFVDGMPKLNTNNDEVIEYLTDICVEWVKKYDIDALRLDVSDEVSHKFNKRLRQKLFSIKPNFYIVGEVWHDPMPWLRGDEFDSAMNYSLQEAIESFWRNPTLTAEDFRRKIQTCLNRYPIQTSEVMFNLLDSHDTPRLITRCGGDVDSFYQELCVLFTLPGTACIYYGTEIRIEGGHDPDCRRCMPWAEIQNGSYDDRIAEMKKLISVRKNTPSLRNGNINFVNSGNDRIIVYDKLDYRVVLNCSEENFDIGNFEKIVYSRKLNGTILSSGGSVIFQKN